VTEPLLPHDRWSELSRRLDEALELPEAARADWLAAQDAHDPAQGAWLRRVLGNAAAATTPEYLERPQIDRAPDEEVQADATRRSGWKTRRGRPARNSMRPRVRHASTASSGTLAERRPPGRIRRFAELFGVFWHKTAFGGHHIMGDMAKTPAIVP
jgi:hypothetical protein